MEHRLEMGVGEACTNEDKLSATVSCAHKFISKNN